MRYLLVSLLLISGLAMASQTQEADVHEVVKRGFLPEPYGRFDVHIKIDENHSIEILQVRLDGKLLVLDEVEVSKMKNIDLSRIFIGHEIFRDREAPFKKMNEQVPDFFEIRLSTKDGVERNHTWYADYYTILIEVESGSSRIRKTTHENP